MLEYCIREDLKLKRARVMAVVDPVKLVIDNYPEDQIEYLDAPNNLENEALGSRKVPFGRELISNAKTYGGASEEILPYVPRQRGAPDERVLCNLHRL